MIRTFNDSLINSYLSLDSAFFKINNASDQSDVYFLYEFGVGVFPSVKVGDTMRMHACIDRKARGRKALTAARKAVKWVFNNTSVSRIETKADKTKRNLLCFNALILNRFKEDDQFVYYEVSR